MREQVAVVRGSRTPQHASKTNQAIVSFDTKRYASVTKGKRGTVGGQCIELAFPDNNPLDSLVNPTSAKQYTNSFFRCEICTVAVIEPSKVLVAVSVDPSTVRNNKPQQRHGNGSSQSLNTTRTAATTRTYVVKNRNMQSK